MLLYIASLMGFTQIKQYGLLLALCIGNQESISRETKKRREEKVMDIKQALIVCTAKEKGRGKHTKANLPAP